MKRERQYKLTSTGTVAALNAVQKDSGFTFYIRIFWGHNPDKLAKTLVSKAIESIPEPWRNNISSGIINELYSIAEGRTGKEALDELVRIRRNAGVE